MADERDELDELLELAFRIKAEGRQPTPEEVKRFTDFMAIIAEALTPIVQAFSEMVKAVVESEAWQELVRIGKEIEQYEGHIPGVDTATHWANGEKRLLTSEAYRERKHMSPAHAANDEAVAEDEKIGIFGGNIDPVRPMQDGLFTGLPPYHMPLPSVDIPDVIERANKIINRDKM